MRIIAIISALSFLSCTSSQNRDACCKEQGPNVAIKHTITYTRKGSRSEARHGHLIINDWELPDVFTYVICGDRVYKFYQRSNKHH